MFKQYLLQIGLEYLINDIQKTELNTFVADSFSKTPSTLSEKEIKDLYVYVVPKISADGSCSIIDTPAEKPYNLAETFRLSFADLLCHPELVSGSSKKSKEIRKLVQNDANTIRLWRLKQIIEKIVKQTGVDWFGIYRKAQNVHNNWVLAKESYKGIFSRPEFPLTKDFAKKSNNSTVGITGKAKVIQDVSANQGPYYTCDGKVQSEFCLPILCASLGRNDNLEVIGIIDAESFPKNFFTNERLLQIAKVAYDLGKINVGI